ncbi:hypothetical protein BU204_05230 [Actinophytocola xanthii]|uniref:HTH cro/C1-type domain-containing protein n=2 Tax=Actinophytocola xanthii TaxID=1912961 RepID=A0A1Q8CWD0_9PSEU|nr:hypothetical protein BU204_05230 [Actinophytocola xanthii]
MNPTSVCPEGFFDRPTLRDAVLGYDFDTVFRLVRTELSLTQEQLGLLVGLSQARISAVERGHHRIRDIAVVARVACALGIPAPLLGFSASTDPTESAENTAKAETTSGSLDRRDLLNVSIGLVLASSITSVLGHLRERLLVAGRPRVAQVGAADVASIEATTFELRKRDFRVGGGSVVLRSLVLSLLDAVKHLHASNCTAAVRSRLMVATADLALCAAWMHYDAGEHDTAGRLWTSALAWSRQSEHPQGADLMTRTLIQLAHQALHLGRPNDGLRFAHLARTVTSVHGPISIATESYLMAMLGWCHAVVGDDEPSLSALDEGEERFERADRSPPPPWSQHVSHSEMSGTRGLVLTLLARKDPRHAVAALPRLTAAVDGFGAEYERTRLMVLPVLAVAALRAGDIELAVGAGRQAVALTESISTVRVHGRLRALVTAAEAHASVPDVAELRADIRASVPLGGLA